MLSFDFHYSPQLDLITGILNCMLFKRKLRELGNLALESESYWSSAFAVCLWSSLLVLVLFTLRRWYFSALSAHICHQRIQSLSYGCGMFIFLKEKMNTLCLSFSSRKRSSVSWNPCSWLSSWCLFSALSPATSQFHGLHRKQACYCHSHSKHGLLEQSRNPLRLFARPLLRTFSPSVFSCLITWWHFIMQSACLCWEWNEKQRGSHVQCCSAGTGVSTEEGGAGSL